MAKIPRVIIAMKRFSEADQQLLRGVAKYAHLKGPWIFSKEPPFEVRQAKKIDLFARAKNWKADGIITKIYNSAQNSLLTKIALPVIDFAALPHTRKFPSITIDSCSTGKLAAEYLLDKGLRNFAYCVLITGPWREKLKGNFIKTVTSAGFSTSIYNPPKKSVLRHWENEQKILAKWLKTLSKPVGIVADCDYRGQHLTTACKIAKLHVPDEVAILGIGNYPLICELANPPLSSIDFNYQRAGYLAAELLDKFIAKKEKMDNQQILAMPVKVVTRQSTDILAINDRDVVNAIRFIRQNNKKIIQVADVVNSTTLSRRSLEQRFHKTLNRSILDEIRRVRIDHITQLLTETNIPISQIALSLGHANFANLSRYFQKQKGMSPLKYRKIYGSK